MSGDTGGPATGSSPGTRATSSIDAIDMIRSIARWLLGGALVVAGLGHLTHQREEFQAQVPDWFPVDADLVVVVSGVVEIALGLALLLATGRWRHRIGWITAAFFIVIFPGNIAQWMEGTDAFGLDTDTARFLRLFFQPVLVAWALWSTGAWRAWRSWRTSRSRHVDHPLPPGRVGGLGDGHPDRG